MEEKSNEIIPGIECKFTKSGIADDAINAWNMTGMLVSVGDFESMTPVQRYVEYIRKSDQTYERNKKPGLFEAVMKGSNPKAVAEFDQLVESFNKDLPKIQETRDTALVRDYIKRVEELRDRSEENPDTK